MFHSVSFLICTASVNCTTSCTALKSKERYPSAYGVAVSTAGLVRRLVEGEDWVTAEHLIQQLRQAASQLQQQLPNLTTAHNVIKYEIFCSSVEC